MIIVQWVANSVNKWEIETFDLNCQYFYGLIEKTMGCIPSLTLRVSPWKLMLGWWSLLWGWTFLQVRPVSFREGTPQGTNISHLGKRKIIFKYALSGGYVNFLDGISTDCFDCLLLTWRIRVLYQTVSNKTWLATIRMFQTHDDMDPPHHIPI